jgi:hypothetical protein
VVVFSQSRIETDSSAVYLNASSVPGEDSEFRWRLAAYERQIWTSHILPKLMEWKWRDFHTGEFLANAFDEPPQPPEYDSRMPAGDPKITWDDLRGSNGMPRPPDSVLVYQYA